MGDELMKKAERKASSKGLMSFLGGSSENVDEALELYEKASNMYRVQKDYESAGAAKLAAAKLCIKHAKDSDMKYRAGNYYHEAADIWKKFNQTQAENAYRKASTYFLDTGYIDKAARSLRDAGEMYGDSENAIKLYEEALSLYETLDKFAEMNKIMEKLADDLSMNKNEYVKAAGYYERIADYHDEHTALKFGVHNFHAKVVLCYLANDDLVTAKKKFEAFCDRNPGFEKSTNGRLCNSILPCIEAYDVNAFVDAVQDYNATKPVDRFETRLLLKIKNLIKDPEESLA